MDLRAHSFFNFFFKFDKHPVDAEMKAYTLLFIWLRFIALYFICCRSETLVILGHSFCFFLGGGGRCTAPFQMILLFIHRNSLRGHRSLAFSWENPKFPFIPYGRPNWIVSLNPCVPPTSNFFFLLPRDHIPMLLLQLPAVSRNPQ